MKTRQASRYMVCLGLAASVTAAGVTAQEVLPGLPQDVVFMHDAAYGPDESWEQELPPPPLGDDLVFEFVAGPIGLGGESVSSAPYSADAIIEVVRTLGDGNRIVHESTATIYRDGAGRSRREQSLAAIGPLVGGGDQARRIVISDPQAGVVYFLDPEKHTARKLQPRRFRSVTGRQDGAAARVGHAGEHPSPMVRFRDRRGGPRPQPVVEQLGKQVIEGVEAEGTRSTVTIPAGEVGNEQPIKIVAERWYSPDLKVVVQSHRSDPRFGEHTYRLTNIVRAEPSPSLFEVPSDYKIVEGQGRRGFVRGRRTP